MQDLVVEVLKNVDVIQLIAIGVMFWFFYGRLNEKTEKGRLNDLNEKTEKNKNELKQEAEKNKIELKQEAEKNKIELKQEINGVRQEAEKNKIELKNELKQEIDGVRQEIEKLGLKVEDIDRRLCRIEGSLATHGHCLFNQKQPDRKAE